MSHDHHDEETLGKPYDARLVRRLMMYVRPYARLVTLAVLMLVAVTCFELAPPDSLKPLCYHSLHDHPTRCYDIGFRFNLFK